jgi:hypothetical protein
VAQFRVEFVLDQETGKYLAELYHPDRARELVARTEALYPSQEAAVLGVVQLFKNAVLTFPKKAKKPKKKAAKARKAKRKATSNRRT